MGVEDIFIDPSVASSKVKLERSIASKRAIAKGETILESDLHMLSPGDGILWADRSTLIGKQAKQDIPANEIIYPSLVN